MVLIDHNYNKAIDIWSIGLILSELMFCSQKYSSQPDFDHSNRYFFPGDSCYPISPLLDGSDEVEPNDMIFKIMERSPKLTT